MEGATLTATAVDKLQAGYPMDSFQGRLRYFGGIVHPSHVLTTQSDVDAATRCLSTPDSCSAEDMNHARWTLAGATHPATGELIPWPIRMATWPILGAFPVSTLLYSANFAGASLGQVAFFQWWNQSQNAAVNAGNGASAAAEPQVMAASYAAAVTVAVTIAVGAGLVLRKASQPGRKYAAFAKTLGKYAPFPSVALANVCNTSVMRRHELDQGIPVYCPHLDVDSQQSSMRVVGCSHVAAQQALSDTCCTRVAVPAINFVAGPLLLAACLPNPSMASFPKRVAACMAVTYVAFAAGLPLSLALYPQTGKLPLDRLEPEIASRLPADTKFVTYNKGI